jgi:hypothetical protein
MRNFRVKKVFRDQEAERGGGMSGGGRAAGARRITLGRHDGARIRRPDNIRRNSSGAWS